MLYSNDYEAKMGVPIMQVNTEYININRERVVFSILMKYYG